jgi:glycosyltransferase involved in cell wall biosynthesis
MDADYKGLPLIQRAARQLWEHRQDFVVQVTLEQVGPLSPGVESIGLHPHSVMPELYANSDVVLALSAHPEPLPYVGIEAFCSARPVVGTRIGGMLDLIGDSSGGWLVDVEQEDELCRTMERLIDRPDERQAAGRAAHLRAKRTYDWQVLFDRQYAPLLQGLTMSAMRV